MYHFKQLKAKYSFCSQVMKPSGESLVYSKTEHVEVLPNLVEGLNFFLKGSSDERINGSKPADFDNIMLRLGKSLYPIQLQVLKTGRIKRVKYFEEIQKRWSKECKNILLTHKNAYWVERYIHMTSKNVRSEEMFLKTLCQNSFMQLFFLEEGATTQHISLYAFPFADNVMEVDFELKSTRDNEYHYKSEIGKVDEKIGSEYSELNFKYTEKGLPENITFHYMAEVVDQGFYTKRITIKLI